MTEHRGLSVYYIFLQFLIPGYFNSKTIIYFVYIQTCIGMYGGNTYTL